MEPNNYKKSIYLAEAFFIYILFAIFSLLSVDRASALGGFLGRKLGPRLAISRQALTNVKSIISGKTEQEYKAIIIGMWDNLGRNLAEYPHLETIADKRVNFSRIDILESIRDDNKPAVIIGAHIANWEVVAPACLKHSLEVDLLYRRLNNPRVDKVLEKARSLNGKLKIHAKSRTGMKTLVKALKNDRHVAILIDQKYNEGIPALFFNKPAMTSPAFVSLAQKFKCPLIPGYVERLGGAHFQIKIFNPIPTCDMNGNPLPVEDVVNEAHSLLEGWILNHPEQWLWLHRRWNKRAEKLFKDAA